MCRICQTICSFCQSILFFADRWGPSESVPPANIRLQDAMGVPGRALKAYFTFFVIFRKNTENRAPQKEAPYFSTLDTLTMAVAMATAAPLAFLAPVSPQQVGGASVQQPATVQWHRC